MEALIEFEKTLYDDQEILQLLPIMDLDFCVERIVTLPTFRPFMLNKAIHQCSENIKHPMFKEKILQLSSKLCPVLLHRLYNNGVLSWEDVLPWLRGGNAFILGYYFRRQIRDFNEYIKMQNPNYLCRGFQDLNEQAIDDMIEYGFPRQSIEYILKYDCVDDLNEYLSINTDQNKNTWSWSAFEWLKDTNKSFTNDLLTFTGIFGSIRCFKVLLLNGYTIYPSLGGASIIGGNLDIINNLKILDQISPKYFSFAAEYSYYPLMKYILEKKELKENRDVDISEIGFPLHLACENGHLTIVHFLMQQGYAVNETTKYNGNTQSSYYLNKTPLMYACNHGSRPIIEYLVENGANVNAADSNLCTPLLYACQCGSKDIVEYLVLNGADVFAQDNYQCTALHFLYEYDSLNLVQYLVSSGLDVNSINKGNGTPLHKACKVGNLNVVRYLVENGAKVDAKSSDQVSTPIQCAVYYGHIDILKYLISIYPDKGLLKTDCHSALQFSAEKGTIDIFKCLSQTVGNLLSDGVYYLYVAAGKGDLEMVKYLVQKGIDVNGPLKVSKFPRGSPLYLAYESNRSDIIDYLTQQGADIDYVNEFETALHSAIWSSELEVVKFLVQNGADINGKVALPPKETKRKQKTVECESEYVNIEDAIEIEKWKTIRPKGFEKNLMSAVEKGCIASVIHHLANRGRANTRDNTGESLLHLASKNGHLNLVKYLVQEGAEIDYICGRVPVGSPLHYAVWFGHYLVVEFLVSKGANINLKGDECFAGTPLHYASYKGHIPIINYLIQNGASLSILNHEGKTPIQLARTEEIQNVLRQKEVINTKQ